MMEVFMSVKETVLKVLEANKGLIVSGQIIAAEAGASRAAVWKAIAQLREEGYQINASTKKGYTLSANSDFLEKYKFCSFILCHQVIFSYLKNGQIFSESGKELDIDSDGSLIVLLEDGNIKTINSGEVTIRKQPE